MTTREEFDRLYQSAKNRRSAVSALLEECWKYVLPLYERRSPFNVTGDQAPPVDEIYDATASSAAQDLASEVLDEIWPADAKPFTLALGRDTGVATGDLKRISDQLSERAQKITEAINGSGLAEGTSWYAAAHEALLDWTIGQGFIAAHRSAQGLCDVWFEHMPLPTVLPLRMNGATCVLFRQSRMKRREIVLRWPAARLRSEFSWQGSDLEADLNVTEGIIRDWSEKGVEAWNTCVKVDGFEGFIHEARETGPGSKPFIDFSFMVANGDTLGRGPAMLALPHIRVANALVQMHLDNLDMSLQGIWGYESGGMNTETIEIKPGLVVPYEPGTKGLVRLDGARNEQGFLDAVMATRAEIRNVMFGSDFGREGRTPPSATEVMARQSVGTKRKSGPHHRLLSGLITQTVQFVDWALTRAGVLKPIDIPAGPTGIDGKHILCKPISPLSRSQRIEEAVRFDRLAEVLATRYGPAAVAVAMPLEKAAPALAEAIGVDPRLIAPQKAFADFAQQLISSAAGQPAAPPAGAGAPRLAA